ncbi:hypothetical protein B5807_10548 [Epicoccum nigrum]|uniref:Uncharacterized protein n=1 Tax=Epicoccum nigrum TaxID=105696 RepID=A0A1Y2LLH6_EPING|nr:hypothetical protein B5807_10548 [Epicoccum nigrum]
MDRHTADLLDGYAVLMQCICTHVLRVPVPIRDLGTHAYDQTALPPRETKIGDVLPIGSSIATSASISASISASNATHASHTTSSPITPNAFYQLTVRTRSRCTSCLPHEGFHHR